MAASDTQKLPNRSYRDREQSVKSQFRNPIDYKKTSIIN